MTPKKTRRGFSLIELVAVMAVLAVLVVLITATLLGTIRIQRADAASFQKMLVHAALADQYRADVSDSIDAPKDWETFHQDRTCLILRRRDGSHLVYRWTENQLERTEFTGERKFPQQVPLGDKKLKVEFARSDTEPRLLHLRLIEEQGKGRRQPPLEISAALGGDRQ
jgi:prepilin-type N-terminal cleavage/methylation domain-containing protein